MIENSTMKQDNLTFRQATAEDIPDLIDCRIRQLIDGSRQRINKRL